MALPVRAGRRARVALSHPTSPSGRRGGASRARGISAARELCQLGRVAISPPLAGETTRVKDRVEAILAERLGARTAATAVRIASRMWLRAEPETLQEEQLLGLTHGLAPLLEKLLGPDLARATLDRVLRDARR